VADSLNHRVQKFLRSSKSQVQSLKSNSTLVSQNSGLRTKSPSFLSAR
jgi:hypothetical protein